MSSEITVKIQSLLWWISSIAVSVLCCSMLFVVFASYMVDIKASVQNNDARIESIAAREDKILFELDALQKRIAPVVVPAAVIAPTIETVAPVITPPASPAPAAVSPVVPEATAPIMPAAPTSVPTSSSTPTTPTATPEKK